MIIDNHVHLLADRDVDGCKMSRTMKTSLAGIIGGLLQDVELKEILELLLQDPGSPQPVTVPSSHFSKYITDLVTNARYINGAVLLALDSIHDSSGTPQPAWSHLVVTNDHANSVITATEVPAGKKLLLGASIHPIPTGRVAGTATREGPGRGIGQMDSLVATYRITGRPNDRIRKTGG